MSADFSLQDIPFESLPTETVRSLCEIAVRHMGSNVRYYDHGLIAQVAKMDYRVPATMRISQGYGYGSTSAIWGALSENREAVMSLLNAVLSDRKGGSQRHTMLGKSDIAPSVITNPDILSFVLNESDFGGGRNGSGCVEGQVFVQVTDNQWNALFEDHPALVAKAFASRPFLLNRFVRNRSMPKDRILQVAKTALGFTHAFDMDAPTTMSREGLSDSSVRPDMEEIYDDLFMHICTICRKDNENMQRIKGDLDSQSVGGKKTRRRDAGWMTSYLNGKWEGGHKDFVIRACRLVPPFFNLMYSSTKVSGEMRTLRRMYQLSGDAN